MRGEGGRVGNEEKSEIFFEGDNGILQKNLWTKSGVKGVNADMAASQPKVALRTWTNLR